MHEFTSRAIATPQEIYIEVHPLNDPAHIRGDQAVTSIFEATSYKTHVAAKLEPRFLIYVEELIHWVSKEFSTISELRKAVKEKAHPFNSEDPDTFYDVRIIKALFFSRTRF